MFETETGGPCIPADLVIFTEEILNRKLHFLCSESSNMDV